MDYQLRRKIFRATEAVFLLGYLALLGTVMAEKIENKKLNKEFHSIPAVQYLDSKFNAQKEAYRLQLDSLRKIYAPNLESKVGDSQ